MICEVLPELDIGCYVQMWSLGFGMFSLDL